MGLFGSKESAEEVESRIRNSEASQTYANAFCNMFSEGGELYSWLMVNPKERMVKLEVYRNGISLTQIEGNRHRLKQTGTYDVDQQAWGFGASGYADLPNSRYVTALDSYLKNQISSRCPNITISYEGNVKLSETVQKGW